MVNLEEIPIFENVFCPKCGRRLRVNKLINKYFLWCPNRKCRFCKFTHRTDTELDDFVFESIISRINKLPISVTNKCNTHGKVKLHE